jgi:hypothetical protein
MRPILAALVVFCLARTAASESVAEFSLDYAREKSTDIVVVDAEGKVLESWRGKLNVGEKLPFKADKKPQAVIEVPRLLESKIKEVTGQRRVLFLKFVPPGRGFDLAPPHYRPVSSLKDDISLATVWIEKGECFAIYQHINPGPGAFMHPLSLDEKRLKKDVEKSSE